jgi:mono/diheme cytochrome c family protein
MPAFGSLLSDAEIRAVLAYIESHWTNPELLKARAEITRNR